MLSKNAIVMGCSVAGLLAAHVLSNHFEDVTIIEKDNYPNDDDVIRKGVPQTNHVHILLAKGKMILEKFFPELEKDLLQKGANKIDFLDDSRYRLPSGWAPKFKSGIITFACTRILLENTIRDQIKKTQK